MCRAVGLRQQKLSCLGGQKWPVTNATSIRVHLDCFKEKPFDRSVKVRLRDAAAATTGTQPFRYWAEYLQSASFRGLSLPLSFPPAYQSLTSNTPPFGISRLDSATQEILEFAVVVRHRSRRLLRPTSHREPSNCRLTTVNSTRQLGKLRSSPPGRSAFAYYVERHPNAALLPPHSSIARIPRHKLGLVHRSGSRKDLSCR
jgi:hypothetical protein